MSPLFGSVNIFSFQLDAVADKDSFKSKFSTCIDIDLSV